jgi:hypothetical protein
VVRVALIELFAVTWRHTSANTSAYVSMRRIASVVRVALIELFAATWSLCAASVFVPFEPVKQQTK